ncbi:MAG: zinc ABC transporter substrate-binding protein [Erysipelotrichaceae bacterium]|nr:zinc ABC transporter substrate-binding protein [Erysipelotrichaceae bacterium]
MKRIVCLLMVLMLILSGCGNHESAKNDKKSVVVTIFPLYDWVREIVGDSEGIELTLLMNKGVDLHNYQASASDIIKITDSDLFIYNGGESDEWIEDILKENKKLNSFSVKESIEDLLKQEEEKEGMQEDEHEQVHEEGEFDEHIWLSLKNTKASCENILNELVKLDSDNKDKYQANYDRYINELDKLDAEYEKAVSSSSKKVLLFADRFPFRYLVDDYGIDYYAAFKGCSAESEASFETIKFLAEKTDELNLKYVMVLENSKEKIANAVINSTVNKNQIIESLDSLQSTTLADNRSYLDVMSSNLEVLKKVLN